MKPPPSPEPDWHALAAHLSGDSADDTALTDSDEAVRGIQAWEAIRPTPVPLADRAAVWTAVRARTEAAPARQESRSSRHHRVSLPRQSRRFWYGLTTACAAALLGIGIWHWGDGSFRVPSSQTASGQEYATRRGERATFTLADGSHVVLAPESRLYYSAGRDGAREVELQGQAHFTVTPDAERPYVVRAAGMTTRVLGTSFAVRAYATDNTAQVAVSEGKVSVSNEVQEVVLLPGDVGNVTTGKKPEVLHDAKLADVFGWMRGHLAFNDVPFEEVATELRRTYDIDIRISTPVLARRPVTATFRGDALETVLSVIGIAVDAKYQWRGRTVTFTAR